MRSRPERASRATMRPLLLLLPALAATVGVAAQAPPPPELANASGVAPFDPATALTAPIAYMVDAGSGRVLFDRESDRRFMPA